MTQNSKAPRVVAGAPHKNLAAGSGGGLDAIVSHPLPKAHQQGLFPASPAEEHLPVVRPVVLVTRGRVEFMGRCWKCDGWHRHIHLGKVTAPCGGRYRLERKSYRVQQVTSTENSE
ncbi:hypothetical protein [Streptomyces sp. 1222.5]|uniref:hypothetical protein n=1 Tax=Streptomyces sp. 1222.5 TaxID=1881026 RepID=UPI003D71C9D7